VVYSIEIDNAILSHKVWKDRLKQAIETGDLGFPVEVIAVDNLCAFGKWLYGPSLTPSDKNTPAYAEIKQLHADFHRMAARIAQHVASGELIKARKMLRSGEDYELMSIRLASALVGWKESLRLKASV
jgi:hypothetical protein